MRGFSHLLKTKEANTALKTKHNTTNIKTWQTIKWSNIPLKFTTKIIHSNLIYLGSTMVAHSFAHKEKLSIKTSKFQYIIRHQSMIQQQICILYNPNSLQSQELRIPRPNSNQENNSMRQNSAFAAALALTFLLFQKLSKEKKWKNKVTWGKLDRNNQSERLQPG